MSSIPTKQIDGDVAVGRNVSAGGNVNVQGNVRIGHDLVVDGWLEAKNIRGVNKGLFATAAALRGAYPAPREGWFAGVAATDEEVADLGLTIQQGRTFFRMYVGSGGEWVCNPLNKLYEIVVDNRQVDALRDDVAKEIDDVYGKIHVLEENLTDARITGAEVNATAEGADVVMKNASGARVVGFSLPVASGSLAGLMSAKDKAGLTAVCTFGHHGVFSGNLDGLCRSEDIGTYFLVSATGTGIAPVTGYLIVSGGTDLKCLYQFIFTDYRFDEAGQQVCKYGRGNIFYRCYYRTASGDIPAGTWTGWKNFSDGLFSGVSTAEDASGVTLDFRDERGVRIQSAELRAATTMRAGLMSSEDKSKLDDLRVNHSVFLVSGTPDVVSYPNIDTKRGLFDFGVDPVLLVDGVEWSFRDLVEESQYREIPITPEGGSSSALVLLFSNDKRRAFKFVPFTSEELDGGVILGTIRRNQKTGEIFGYNFPFTVTLDGQLPAGGGGGDVGSLSEIQKRVNILWGIVHEGEASSICVYVDLDNDSNEEIWDKISRQEALIYFLYESGKIRGALAAPSGEDAYSVSYMTDAGMKSTRIKRSVNGGNISYHRDDYYTVIVE